MAILWSNNASTTIAGSITATDTTVALAAGTGIKFPSPTSGDYFVATFYDQATKTINEIVHVSARVGDTCTIIRGQEGTTPQAWSAADIFANLVTAGTLDAFVQAGTGPADTSIVYVGTDVSSTPSLVVCPTNPVPPSYEVGMLFNIKIKNTNLGPVQLQFNGLASVPAVRTDGSPMVGANLISSQEMMFVYNGVNFNAMVPPVPQAPPQTTFYVRTDGNDNNSGFANTPADAFRTISGAMYEIKQRYISQNTITIRVADGLYIDGISESIAYIAAWNIVGNPANPGNVVINALSTNGSAYPPYAMVGSAVGVFGSGNVTVNGFTFQSYTWQAFADGGTLTIYNCHFTAPTTSASPIYANETGSVAVFGNCQYSGATPVGSIFSSSGSGFMGLGFYEVPYASNPLVFNIAANSVITQATATAWAGGCIVTAGPNGLSFTGSVPDCPQYTCSTGGGIGFEYGDTTIFPGTSPGIVTLPGWID
jgi:hypothetical protein